MTKARPTDGRKDRKWQVSSEYKMCRTFFEPPAPTDQTEHSRSMKFGMVTPWGNRSGVIEAIFDISPLTRDMGVGWGTPGVSKIMKNFFSQFSIFFTEYDSTRSELIVKRYKNHPLLFSGDICAFKAYMSVFRSWLRRLAAFGNSACYTFFLGHSIDCMPERGLFCS